MNDRSTGPETRFGRRRTRLIHRAHRLRKNRRGVTGVTEPQQTRAAEERGREPLTAVRWTVGSAIGITLAVIAITLVAGIVAGAILLTKANGFYKSMSVAIALGIGYLVQLAVVRSVARRKGSELAPAVGMRWPENLGGWALIGIATAFGIRLFTGVYALVLEALHVQITTKGLDVTQLLPKGPLGTVVTILLVAFIAPLVEEVVFRGVLLSALRTRWGDTVGIVSSSVVFGFLHVSALAILPIIVLAVFLGLLFVRSRSLYVPIMTHIAFNSIGLIALYALHRGGMV